MCQTRQTLTVDLFGEVAVNEVHHALHAALVGGRLQLSFLDGRLEVVEAEGNTGSGANIMDFPHDAHRAVIADFLDAIEAGRDPVVTGEEALTSQRWIDAILAAGR